MLHCDVDAKNVRLCTKQLQELELTVFLGS
jgi:hypothetical protein